MFIVDDNFTGNKKAAKGFLRLVIPWQEKHGYPLRLVTQASIDLANDPELLDLLYQANFRSVFIGIETVRTASLNETKKLQNIAGDSLDAKLARIRNAGLDISAGFILGFDNDDKTIFEDQFLFIQDNGILMAIVGRLMAVPKTPLYDRLKKEGRLKPNGTNCNIVPKQMTSAELKQGYWDLLNRLYAPRAFLDRSFKVAQFPEFRRKRAEICNKAGEGKRIRTLSYGMILLWNLFWALLKDRSLTKIGSVYVRYFFGRSLRYRSDIIGFAQFMNTCVTHWHFYKYTREGTNGNLRLFNSR